MTSKSNDVTSFGVSLRMPPIRVDQPYSAMMLSYKRTMFPLSVGIGISFWAKLNCAKRNTTAANLHISGNYTPIALAVCKYVSSCQSRLCTSGGVQSRFVATGETGEHQLCPGC